MSVFKLTKMCTSNMCNFLYIMHNSMKSKKYVGAADVLDNKEYREMSRVFSRFSSVAQSCPTLCNPMDCSMPGFPVYQQLLELAQTHVHQVGNAIQPSHPLSSPSPPTLNLSLNQGLFKWVNFLHQVAEVLEFQLQHQSFQWIFRTDFLEDWLVWSPRCPRDSQKSSSTP